MGFSKMATLKWQWPSSSPLSGTNELNFEVHSLVIDGICRVGRLEEARKKLDQLSEKGLVRDVVI